MNVPTDRTIQRSTFPAAVPRRPVAWLVLLLWLLATLPAAARSGEAIDRRELLDAIREQLDAGEWSKAAKVIRRAETLILEKSLPMRGDDKALAELALYRAVVAANQDRADEAEWFWYLVYHLHQPTAHRDLPDWGKAAAVLGAVVLRDLYGDPPGVETFGRHQAAGFESPEMPVANTPDSLESSHDMDKVKAFNVEVYLDVEGRPHAPRFLGPPPHPMMLYGWMQQMWEGKWRPARFEGKPVPLLVTIDQAVEHQRW